MNIQGWFPLGFISLMSLLSKGLLRVCSNTSVPKHQFFGAQFFMVQLSHPHMTLVKPELWPDGPCWQSDGSAFSYAVQVCHGGFPHSSAGKESACSAGDSGSIPGSGRSPGEGNGNPLQYSCLEHPLDPLQYCCLEHPMDWSGSSPWGHKESDTT